MKTTKKALLTSGLCLGLSAALLVGTTFAWFTDSVTNEGNVITAGNLSIGANFYDLKMDNTSSTGYVMKGINGGNKFYFETEGHSLKDEECPPIIDKDNWEPGVSDAKLLTVENTGSLNAKIKVDFDITEDGLEGALWYDFIQVKDGKVLGTFTKRNMDSIESIGDNLEIPVPANNSVSFILVYGMKESANNTFQGKNFEGYVNILATQATGETDGFNNDKYDQDAQFPNKTNPSSTVEGVETGADVTVPEGVTTVDGGLTIPAKEDTSITLKGETGNPEDTILDMGSGSITFGGAATQTNALQAMVMNALDAAEDTGASKTLVLKDLTIRTSGIAVKYAETQPGTASNGLKIVLDNCVIMGEGSTASGVLMGTGTCNSVLEVNGSKLVNLSTGLAVADFGNNLNSVKGETNNTVTLNQVAFDNCANQYQLFYNGTDSWEGTYYVDVNDVMNKGDVDRFNNVFTIDGKKLLPQGTQVNTLDALVAAMEDTTDTTPIIITEDQIVLDDMYTSSREIIIAEDATLKIANYGSMKGLNAKVTNYGTIKNENEYGGVMFDYDSQVINYGTIDAGDGNVSLRGSYFYNGKDAKVIADSQVSIGSENLGIDLGVRGTFENYGYIEAKGSVGSNCGIVITADGQNYGTIYSSKNPYGGIQVEGNIKNYGVIKSDYEYGNSLQKDYEGNLGTVTNLDGGITAPAFD